MIITHVSRRIV